MLGTMDMVERTYSRGRGARDAGASVWAAGAFLGVLAWPHTATFGKLPVVRTRVYCSHHAQTEDGSVLARRSRVSDSLPTPLYATTYSTTQSLSNLAAITALCSFGLLEEGCRRHGRYFLQLLKPLL